ncbi:MAG: metal ABC transporter permease [Spirochaetota bacterium]
MIDILFTAFLLSVVLVGIHSYFGLEIIKRGIIFTDLAIGQMAAFGAAISLLFFDGRFIYIISLSFAIVAAIVIAYSTKKSPYPEAIIGLLYAFSLSAVYIALSKTYHGMEEFQRLLASDILFSHLDKIVETAVIYSFIGVALFVLHRNVKINSIKNILFFVLFAITVTSSVKLAGVLIVFSLLLSPAMIALAIAKNHTLIAAWIIGTVLNLVSIWISYSMDLPTGYTLVAVHTVTAIGAGMLSIKN